MTKTTLVLDLEKAARMPGAASMFPAHDAERAARREHDKLYSPLHDPGVDVHDRQVYANAGDVVKGLGFQPNDEAIWAHRVSMLVGGAKDAVHLRKSVHELRGIEGLTQDTRGELGRRIIALWRNKNTHDVQKGFGAPGAGGPPGAATRPPKGPPSPGGGSMGPGGPPGKPPPGTPPIDGADLEQQPSDPALLKQKIHALHETLKGLTGHVGANAAMIHMFNDLKSEMRNLLRDPEPEAVAALDHKIHHFEKLVQGPAPIDPALAQPGQMGGPPKPGGFKGGPPGAGGPKGPPQQFGKSELVIDLEKAAEGGMAPTHKYISRKPAPGGGWIYDYGHGPGVPPGGPANPTPAPGAEALAPGAVKTALPPKPLSTMNVGGTEIHKFAPGQAPSPTNVDEKGRPKDRHWIDHLPEHPTFEQGGTAKKYGIGDDGIPKDPARAKLHEEIIAKHFDHVPSVPAGKKPIAVVTMGGPASGKTTALKQLGKAGRKDFVQVDPDAIKTGEEHLGTSGLPEFHEAAGVGHLADGTPVSSKSGAAVVHDESSAIADRLRDKAVGARKNVIIDGTGKNADKHVKLINDLKARGYHVHLVMPHQTADQAKKLNKGRAAATGRHVPESIVDEAYSKIPHNFDKVAAAADKATLFDASNGFPPKLVYEKDGGDEKIHDPDFMSKFRSEFSGVKKSDDEDDDVSPKGKKGGKKPLSMDQGALDKLIHEAMVAGARHDIGHLAGGASADEGMSDEHAFEDDHFDAIKR